MDKEEINIRSKRRTIMIELLKLFNVDTEDYSYSEMTEQLSLILKNEFNRVKEKEYKFKKYIVFAYMTHDCSGGLDDIHGSADTIEDAKNICAGLSYDNIDIVDRDTWEVIA